MTLKQSDGGPAGPMKFTLNIPERSMPKWQADYGESWLLLRLRFGKVNIVLAGYNFLNHYAKIIQILYLQMRRLSVQMRQRAAKSRRQSPEC
jgi:hypothetical protein